MESGRNPTAGPGPSRVRPGAAGILLLLASLLAGCGTDLSAPLRLPVTDGIPIEDSSPKLLHIEADPGMPILVEIAAADVDVRAAIVGDAGGEAAYCDAPNRRMGIETLLVDAPHAPIVTVRIDRNDHSAARGTAAIQALALPLVTAADRQRLRAAREDAAGCIAFSESRRGGEAAAAFQAAARSWGEVGDDRRQGLALLHAAGVHYQRLSDWQSSADLAARASRRLAPADARAQAAFALRLEGAALDQLADAADFDLARREQTARRARERLTQAAARFDELAMPYEAGYAFSYRGVSIGKSGNVGLARDDFRAALKRFRAAGDGPAEAVALQSLAYHNFEDGRSEDASREFEQALALIPREEEPANYAHTLHNSALPLRFLGHFDEAIRRHHEAAEILHRVGDRDGEARALHSLGLVMAYVGDRDRAAELLRTAIRLRGESGARSEQAVALVNLAEIERAAGRVQAAIGLDREALALMTAPADRARALLSLARDYLASGEPARARGHLEELLRLGLPRSSRHMAYAAGELAGLEYAQGNRARAEQLFAEALEAHAAGGVELDRARTLQQRAQARLQAGEPEGALADVGEALALFDRIGMQALHAEARAAYRAGYRDAVELQILLLLREAQRHRQAGRAAEADRRLRQALAASDRARAQLLREAAATRDARIPAALQSERELVYERLAGKRQQLDRLLDAGQEESERALRLARDLELLRAQARLLDGRIAQAQSGASDAAEVGGIDVDSIPGEVLVAEYFIGRRSSWLFEVGSGRVAVHELAAGDRLEEMSRRLHESWRSAAPGDADRSAGSLARQLFGPLGNEAPAAQVWIVPDGALHLVPMALLARQFWPGLRPGAAVVVPALATLRPPAAAGDAPDRTLAIVADPIYQTDDPRIRGEADTVPQDGDGPAVPGARATLRRLPSTAVEAREISALVGDPAATLRLIGPEASRSRVAAAPLDRYRIVHFATHALADSRDPALATLALSRYDAEGRALDGDLRTYEIGRLRLSAELVVLSGCDTALGREIAGEGPIGLSQAFLGSGAGAVLATLWQVPDSSTAVLMREFYREMLVNGRTAAAALELAQARLRRQPRWSDPFFWAGFQLVSNVRLDTGHHNDVAGREES